MKTILEKNGEKFQVNDRRQKPQMNFTTFKSGHTIPNHEEELLLPLGVEDEDEDDEPQTNEVKPLYPNTVN